MSTKVDKKEKLKLLLEKYPRGKDSTITFIAAVSEEDDKYLFLATKNDGIVDIVTYRGLVDNSGAAEKIIAKFRRA